MLIEKKRSLKEGTVVAISVVLIPLNIVNWVESHCDIQSTFQMSLTFKSTNFSSICIKYVSFSVNTWFPYPFTKIIINYLDFVFYGLRVVQSCINMGYLLNISFLFYFFYKKNHNNSTILVKSMSFFSLYLFISNTRLHVIVNFNNNYIKIIFRVNP